MAKFKKSHAVLVKERNKRLQRRIYNQENPPKIKPKEEKIDRSYLKRECTRKKKIKPKKKKRGRKSESSQKNDANKKKKKRGRKSESSQKNDANKKSVHQQVTKQPTHKRRPIKSTFVLRTLAQIRKTKPFQLKPKAVYKGISDIERKINLLKKRKLLIDGISMEDTKKCQEVMYTFGVKLMGPKMRRRFMFGDQDVNLEKKSVEIVKKPREPNKSVLLKMTEKERRLQEKSNLFQKNDHDYLRKYLMMENQPQVRLEKLSDEMVKLVTTDNQAASKTPETSKNKEPGHTQKKSETLETRTQKKRKTLEKSENVETRKTREKSKSQEASKTQKTSTIQEASKTRKTSTIQETNKSQEPTSKTRVMSKSQETSTETPDRIRSGQKQTLQVLNGLQMCQVTLSDVPRCDCSPKMKKPCGNLSNCLNRRLKVECHPHVCPGGKKCLNQRFQKKKYAKTETFTIDPKRLGFGLRNTSPIRKGQFVHEYRTIDCGPDEENLSRYINHSEEPNLETQRWTVNKEVRIGLFALEDIESGTELTFNHNFDHDCSDTQCPQTNDQTQYSTENRRKTSQQNISPTYTSHHIPCIVLEDNPEQKSRKRSSRVKTPSSVASNTKRRRTTRSSAAPRPIVTPMFDDSDDDDFCAIDIDISNI